MGRSIQQMRIDQADYARDAKKEEAMCAKGGCQSSHNLRDSPQGYRGPYGGTKVCNSCYEELVDYLAKHGHLPNESHSEGWCDDGWSGE